MTDAGRYPAGDKIEASESKQEAARNAAVRGWQHLKKGDASTAASRFNQALILDPNYADAFWGMGATTSLQGKFDASISLFERAYALDPKNVGLTADVGVAYMRRAMSKSQAPAERAKGLDSALEWFDKAEKIDPFYEQTLVNRAIALAFLGDYNKAWANVERAEALNEKCVDTKFISYLSEQQPRPVPSATAQLAQSNKPEAVNDRTKTQPLDQPAVPAPGPVDSGAIAAQASEVTSQPVVQQVALPLAQPENLLLSKTETKPEPEKKLKLVSGKASLYRGKDLLHCLNLPTNAAIASCAYK
jgi:tetratricopeptide (TPR) repeat protein